MVNSRRRQRFAETHRVNEIFLKGRYRTFMVISSAPPVPVSARSKARDCGRSLAGIAVSNPAGGMDISLVRFGPLRLLRRDKKKSSAPV